MDTEQLRAKVHKTLLHGCVPSNQSPSICLGRTLRPTEVQGQPAPVSRGLAKLAVAGGDKSARPALVLGETIGCGGLGKVKRAYQPELEREVAVKHVREDSSSPEAGEDLLREARLTGALEHPNVVPIHGIGNSDEAGPLVIMKFIQGAHWGERLSARSLPVAADALAEDLKIVVQLCQVAHFAHSRGIIHRDIKPANVMLGAFGEVYLVDWGLGMHLSDAQGDEAVISGTPAYMAPEMVRGPCKALGPQTDVYLLGATLHEVITGRPLHDQPTISDALMAAAESNPVEYGPEVPPELAAICRRACQAEPSERFPTAIEMKQAIETYLELRDAHRILRLTQQRARALQSAVEELAPQDLEAASRVQVLFHEALFGFEQVLAIAPDFEPARAQRAECLGRMLAFQIRQKDARAARAVLGMLEVPAQEQRLAVEQLESEDSVRKKRMERLEHDVDRRVAARQRALFGILIAATVLAWNTFAVISAMRPQAIVEAGLTRTFGVAVVLWVVVVAAAAIWRKKFLENEANRRFISIMLVLFSAVLLNRGCALISHAPIQPVIVADMLFFGFAVMLMRQLMRSAYILGFVCWASAVVVAFSESHRFVLLLVSVVTSAVAAAVAFEWTFRRFKRGSA